jgi:hypothetical protein
MDSFKEVMSNNSDEKLIDILKNRNKYQPIAVDAAVNESINRKIIIDSNDLEVKYPMSGIISVQNEISEQEYISAKKKQAENDMLYGALWCIGGIIATAAHIGFIFWGAILFGGIQFCRGLFNSK